MTRQILLGAFTGVCLVLLSLSTGENTVFHNTVAAQCVWPKTQKKQLEQDTPSSETTHSLRPKHSIQKKISGIESQTLDINLPIGQYAQVLFEWQGMDLEIEVRKPNGSPLFARKMALVASGALPISLIANEPGKYDFRVRAMEQLKVVGSYLVTLVRQEEQNETNRRLAEATALTLEAPQQKGKQEIIERYLRALALWESTEDERGQAYTLQRLGNSYISIKDLSNAEKYFENAIEIRRRIGDARSLAYTIREIGADYRSFDSPTKAIEYYQRALAIAREAGDRRAESDILYSIGFAEARIGRMERAVGFYEKALAIQESENFELNEARTLNSLGGAYDVLSHKDKALNYYEQAARRFERLGDRYRQAIALNNIGLIHDDWGDYQTAKDKYSEALAEFKNQAVCEAGASTRALNICSAMASTLDNLGELSNTLGDPKSALIKFNESMGIRNLLNQPQASGSTLSRIGYSHLLLGNFPESLRYLQQALDLNDKAEDLRGSAYTLTFSGMAYAALNDTHKAQEYFERALVKQKEAQDRRGQAVTLDKLGSLYATNSQWEAAQASFDQALRLWRDINDPDGETITLYNKASAEFKQGNYRPALELSFQALKIVESTRRRLTSQQLMRHYFANKQNHYDLQIDVYMLLASREKSDDLVAKALEVKERAVARNLLDTLEEARSLGGHRSKLPKSNDARLNQLVQRQLELAQSLSSKGNARRELISGEHEKQARIAIDREIEELLNEYDTVDSKIRAISPRYVSLQKPEPIEANDIKQQVDNDTLLLEYALGEKRSYAWVVSQNSIHGFELPPRDQIEKAAHRLTEAVTERNRQIKNETWPQTQARMKRSEAEYKVASEALSKMIIEPVAHLLDKKRLVVVPDGALQTIPFTALPISTTRALNEDTSLAKTNSSRRQIPSDSSTQTNIASQAAGRDDLRETKPLITKYEIITLPSASVLALQRRELKDRKPAPLAVAVLADPVYDQTDVRVARALRTGGKGNQQARRKDQVNEMPANQGPSNSTAAIPQAKETSLLAMALRDVGIDGSLQRLDKSRQEAEAITRVAPPNQSFKALDFEASRETATGPELSKYQYIHFATHGVMDLEHPELSGIVLSMVDEKGQLKDGYLRLHEIYNLNLPAELIVLSGCQTGVGKQIKGEGLIALTRGFMYAGAKSVVASLWKVDDAATADLMAEFYRQMFSNKLKPAAALRAAQLKMSQQKRYESPYYWAGFFIQGEWN